MILYVDASALTKRYLPERGSGQVARWTAEADLVLSSRVAFVEVRRAIGLSRLRHADELRDAFAEHWAAMDVVAVTQEIVEVAANVGVTHDLASLDAIHLASALSVQAPDLYLATFDRRLWAAAGASGLNVLPETLE